MRGRNSQVKQKVVKEEVNLKIALYMIDLNLLNIYGRRWFKLASKGKNTMLFWDTAKHHIS